MTSPDGAVRRSYDASNRRSTALRNRAAVIAACRELLLRDGYQATTVRAVATRAGVSPETVYKAFGSKPGLMKAVWDATLAGDDEPVPMSDRPVLRQVWATQDPHTKLRLYAAFVCDVHTRLAKIFSLLSVAGPDVAQVLATAEQERLTGVSAFLAHLADVGALRADTDQARRADACWALTGPHLYIQLTTARGWSTDTYQQWLTEILVVSLLS